MKNILTALLILVAAILAYSSYDSLLKPIRFNEERELRETKIKQRLLDIRAIQDHHFDNNDREYILNADSLSIYAKAAEVVIVQKDRELTDEELEAGLTEEQLLAEGKIIRDTIRYPFVDSVLGHIDYNLDSIAYIPYGGGKKFEIEGTEIETSSKTLRNLIEVRAPFSIYLAGINKQELINLHKYTADLERYPGLKIGDLEKANGNAGNW